MENAGDDYMGSPMRRGRPPGGQLGSNPYASYESPQQQNQMAALEAIYRQQLVDIQLRRHALADQQLQQMHQARVNSPMMNQQRLYELQRLSGAAGANAQLEEQLFAQHFHQQRMQLQPRLSLGGAPAGVPQSPQQQRMAQLSQMEAASLPMASSAAFEMEAQRLDNIPRDPSVDAAAALYNFELFGRMGDTRQQYSVTGGQADAHGMMEESDSGARLGATADAGDFGSIMLAAAAADDSELQGEGTTSELVDLSNEIESYAADLSPTEEEKNEVDAAEDAARSSGKPVGQEGDDMASLILNLHTIPADWSDSDSLSGPAVPSKSESISVRGFHSVLPELPIEPELHEEPEAKVAPGEDGGKHGAASSKTKTDDASKKGSKKGKKDKEGNGSHKSFEYPFPVDSWFPSVSSSKREKRPEGEDDDEAEAEPRYPDSEGPLFTEVTSSMRSRLETEMEPGVLEKIPHCKLHRMRTKSKVGYGGELLFCWQVTESYCNEVMVCCSICSTWRHAFCGGHYKGFAVQDLVNSSAPFTAICDRCWEEKEVLEEFPKGKARLDRQRTEHLRHALSTTAVVRQACFAKHGGTYKWPLGSVSATHIGGHTRSVHSRHERAERQWNDAVGRLGTNTTHKSKERARVRTRELEKLLVSVEDAEGITDRHNITLFLQRDTTKDQPCGFEGIRRNLFDPEEDEAMAPVLGQLTTTVAGGGKVDVDMANEPDQLSREKVNGEAHSMDKDASQNDAERMTADASKEETDNFNGTSAMDLDQNDEGQETDVESSEGANEVPETCARPGCELKPRFDSMFCSDACGVSALERDILQSFYYADDVHPALLRS